MGQRRRDSSTSLSGIRGTNDTKQNFDFIIILVAMTTEIRKLRKKYLKIFSSKTTDQILMKLHLKRQCNMRSNDTERNFDLIIIVVAMATERKKLQKNT